ncbi:MAG: CPBP family intramembrane metalloprotease [Acidobacteria bacterium]|nr:CPBP family intramembrane metalloprotease [Acidobacteriota bacterium]
MELEQNLAGDRISAADNATANGVGPNNPPWGPFEGLGVWFASVLCTLIVPAAFLLPYLALHQPRIVDNDQLVEFAKSDPTAVILQIAAVLPAHLLTFLIAWLVITRFRKYNFREMVGWQTGGGRMWLSFLGLILMFFAISIVVSQISAEQDNDLLKILRSSRAAVYIIAFISVATAPFVEEVVYRGVLYSAFQRWIGVPGAFLLTTLLFALVHVPQYWPSYSTIFLLTLLSLILTAIRVRTNNLLPCIIFHTIFNGLESISIMTSTLTPKADLPDPTGLVLHLFR